MSSSKSSNSEPPTDERLNLVVSDEHQGVRLDQWLASHPAIPSREAARRLIVEGEVQINQSRCEPSSRLKAGDLVEVHLPPPKPSHLVPFAAPLTILYEDSWLAVVDKPAGLPMHPSPGHREDTLVHRLLAHCDHLSGIGGTQRPGIVHRLDKDTSGVVVVAKNDAAHQHLAQQFKDRTIHRTYQALVIGNPPRNAGKIDMPLGRHKKNPLKRAPDDGGKHAVTHWTVLERLPPFTFLQLKLETGRTHQIRVHLKEVNWPVAGDPLYGGRRFRGMQLSPRVAETLNLLQRQALHAKELGFVHPEHMQELTFSSPLPQDLADLLELLRQESRGFHSQ